MDKIIVITGSTYGLGASLGLHLLRQGATVIFNYTNDYNAAKIIREKAEAIQCGKYHVIRADVSKQDEVQFFVDEVITNVGIPDILINNAASAKSHHMLNMNYTSWQKVLDVNLNGVFFCSKQFARKMLKKGKGKIINIGSLTGERGLKANCNYSSSKAALVGLTRSMANDLYNFSIMVNLVYPPSIITNLNKIEKKSKQTEIYTSSFQNFVSFMCTDEFHSISGQVFCLNNKMWGDD